MILINLLPPELRKRASTGISPLFAGAVGGGVLVLLMASAFLWLQFSRLPKAEQIVVERTQELGEKTIVADRVLALKATIIDYENRRDSILALINRKVYWARTIDEFSSLLTGQWSVEGFQVSVQDMTMAEIPGDPKAPDNVRCSFRWRYKLIGGEDRSGDYINSFFKTIELSRFWIDHGFVDKPDLGYDGDRPRWNPQLQKVVVEGTLNWERLKIALKPGTKPVAQGN